MDRLFLVCVAVSFQVVSWNASAELYKWIDAKGRTHYSDRAPLSDITLLDYQAPADNHISAPAKIKYPKYAPVKKRSKARRRAKISCDKYLSRIDKVQKQLRAGYREPKGNKLRARKRELNDQLRRCRKGFE